MTRPFCFVLMPFGKKPNAAGSEIDFDAVYSNLIAPAIEDAGLEPIRADHEVVGGLIHKPMYERLVLCDYAVADLTTANANVFYELGLRHARLAARFSCFRRTANNCRSTLVPCGRFHTSCMQTALRQTSILPVRRWCRA